MQEVEIYTDGACSNNPGPGGWGAVLLWNSHEKEISGSSQWTTNQRMELEAAVQALKTLKYPCKVKLYSDSAYLVNAFNQKWYEKWQKNNWKTSSNKKVDNQDLWKELIKLSKVHQIEWIKVKGHSGDKYNERSDELARAAIPGEDK